ncbi:hypothetical protein WJX72_011246 [[Myrmecia] bisecta]|uniref:Regulatory protein RecX n=1 Tax=[Myrmecia] bisecta TaxID=41462 RepID=A0AAW1PXV5_9CHLO
MGLNSPGLTVVSGQDRLQSILASLPADEDPDSLKLDPVKERAFQSAKNSASGMLSRRPHSRHMLETKLLERGHEPQAIKEAIDRLEEVGLHSDTEYAEVYARSKWRQARWAPLRIRMELQRRGVSKADIAKGLAGVFGEDGRVHIDLYATQEEDEEAVMFGTERDDRSDRQLLEAARKQAAFTDGLPVEARRRRMIGWLQRRGHDWDTTSKVLTLLDLK